jgi:hypothetical protein
MELLLNHQQYLKQAKEYLQQNVLKKILSLDLIRVHVIRILKVHKNQDMLGVLQIKMERFY